MCEAESSRALGHLCSRVSSRKCQPRTSVRIECSAQAPRTPRALSRKRRPGRLLEVAALSWACRSLGSETERRLK